MFQPKEQVVYFLPSMARDACADVKLSNTPSGQCACTRGVPKAGIRVLHPPCVERVRHGSAERLKALCIDLPLHPNPDPVGQTLFFTVFVLRLPLKWRSVDLCRLALDKKNVPYVGKPYIHVDQQKNAPMSQVGIQGPQRRHRRSGGPVHARVAELPGPAARSERPGEAGVDRVNAPGSRLGLNCNERTPQRRLEPERGPGRSRPTQSWRTVAVDSVCPLSPSKREPAESRAHRYLRPCRPSAEL